MKYLAGLLIVFFVGGMLGAKTVTPEVDIVRIEGPTKVIHEPAPPPEKIEVVDEDCVALLELSETISKNSGIIWNAHAKQLTIISEGRQAIAAGDTNALSELENRSRKLYGTVVEAYQEVEDAEFRYEQLKGKCDK